MSITSGNTPLRNRRNEGSALLVAVMMLVLMGLIGIAALDTMTKDRQVAGYQQRARLAYYAADAGAAAALDIVSAAKSASWVAPALPTTPLGDAVIYPYGQPSYAPDPTVANAVAFWKAGHAVGDGNSLGAGSGGPTLINTLWKIRVLGQTPDGGTAVVEVVATYALAGGANYQ